MKPGSYPDLQNLARYLDPLHRYVKTCYVAHVKAMHGLVTRKAWNRQGPERLVPCPRPWYRTSKQPCACVA